MPGGRSQAQPALGSRALAHTILERIARTARRAISIYWPWACRARPGAGALFHWRCTRASCLRNLRTSPSRPTHRRHIDAINHRRGLRREACSSFDNVGHVRYANPAAAKMLGYETEELSGLDYRVLISTARGRRFAHRSCTSRALHDRHHARRRRSVTSEERQRSVRSNTKSCRLPKKARRSAPCWCFVTSASACGLDNLLKDMQATAKIGGWEYDVTSKAIALDRGAVRHPRSAGGHPIDVEAHRAFFHPEDRF